MVQKNIRTPLATLAKVQNHKTKAGALEEIQLIRPVH